MKIKLSWLLCFVFCISVAAYAGIAFDLLKGRGTAAYDVKNAAALHRDLHNFHDWSAACASLPMYDENVENPFQTIFDRKLLNDQMDQFFKVMQTQFDGMHWIDEKAVISSSHNFQAYVQKLIVPADAIIAIHGDLHGDIHSLNRFIQTCADAGYLDKQNPFKIADPKFYMLFLGDYVDRGWYGVEVLYTIVRLKNENPSRVFMVRGNHEDVSLNARYGFAHELQAKFFSDQLFLKCNQLYNALPVALYLGAEHRGHHNIIQCCHGGIELGFDPARLLEDSHRLVGMKLSTLMQADGFAHVLSPSTASFKKHFHNHKPVDTYNGFMWSDFIVDPQCALSLSARDGYSGIIFEYGKQVTQQILKAWSGKSYTLRSIFRAHQHSCPHMRRRILNEDAQSHPDDRGVGKLWIEKSVHKQTPALLDDVDVVTFSVAPHAGYEWPVHAFGMLHVAPEYKDWRLQVVRA